MNEILKYFAHRKNLRKLFILFNVVVAAIFVNFSDMEYFLHSKGEDKITQNRRQNFKHSFQVKCITSETSFYK